MTQLGEQFRKEAAGKQQYIVMVYTDTTAINLFDKINNLTPDEEAIYDANFVARYNKNDLTGNHDFVIYFDGLNGSNTKTISY